MNLDKRNKSFIIKHSLEENPKECCGFILENKEESFAVKCRNAAQDPFNFFSISPFDYIKAKTLGKIVAVYHSHIEQNSFSEFDKSNSVIHNLPFFLYCIKDNCFQFFDPKLSDFNRYIGVKFSLEKNHCAELIRSFFKHELKIDLNSYETNEYNLKNNVNLFESNLERENFRKVESLDKIKKYDCLFFKRRGENFASHIALYLGNDMILHQPMNTFSRIESYSSLYKKLTLFAARHSHL